MATSLHIRKNNTSRNFFHPSFSFSLFQGLTKYLNIYIINISISDIQLDSLFTQERRTGAGAEEEAIGEQQQQTTSTIHSTRCLNNK
jgi:hypothetical protein